MHSVLILYLHDKFEKIHMTSIMSMGQADPQNYITVVLRGNAYYAIGCNLFSSFFTYLNVSLCLKRRVY